MTAQLYTVAEVARMAKVSEHYIREQVRLQRVIPLRLSDPTPREDGRRPPARMRFTDEHVAQLLKALQPLEVQTQRRRRRRAAS